MQKSTCQLMGNKAEDEGHFRAGKKADDGLHLDLDLDSKC